MRFGCMCSDPSGIRTRVAAVKGRCPGPLDDGADEAAVRGRRPGRWENMPIGSPKASRAAAARRRALGRGLHYLRSMLHYFKFRQDLFAPQPAKEIYVKRGAGRGWPEECPPIRAANAFGFDLLANFDATFTQGRGGAWRVEKRATIVSDFDWAAHEGAKGAPLTQDYAWFWERGQKLPHAISDNVYAQIRNQVKVSSFLFLKTDPNELLLMTDVPNANRPWRSMSALIDTDWYPASYPW